MAILVNPLDEQSAVATEPAPRLDRLEGRTLALLDISKPGGSYFLDRLEQIFREHYGVARILREKKPTYTKPAPAALIERLATVDGVVEALAD